MNSLQSYQTNTIESNCLLRARARRLGADFVCRGSIRDGYQPIHTNNWITEYLSTIVLRLLARCAESSNGQMTRKRMNKFSKYNMQIESCGDDLARLDRFVEAQRVAFYKLLKKYTVWTVTSKINNAKTYLTSLEMDRISNTQGTIRSWGIGQSKKLHKTRF